MRPRRSVAAVTLAAAVAVVGAVASCQALQSAGGRAAQLPAGQAEVVRVVDGDTIVVDLQGRRETVRLLGVDTPESVDPRRPVECFGKEAAAYTASLVAPGTLVRLVVDVELRDQYSRLLAYVYRVDDGTFINLRLVLDGYASVLTYPPNVAHAPEFVSAAAEARIAGRGLWAAC